MPGDVARLLVDEFVGRLRDDMPRVESLRGFTFAGDYREEGWGPLWWCDEVVVDGRGRDLDAIKVSNRRQIDTIVRETLGSVRDRGVADMVSRHFRDHPDVVLSGDD